MRSKLALLFALVAATCSLLATHGAFAEDAAWRVSKSSGEVWVASAGAQPVALTDKVELKAGDGIRTGKNGRALLVRGEETILLAPNSAISLPTEAKDGMATTIVQQAGSILLEVEKRNVQHFEVVTPYLAAVVKGTQFRVSVDEHGGRVDVARGQVEVADFKSGQFALVLPGQAASIHVHGAPGLALSGTGPFNEVQRGTPRVPDVKLIPVPKGGLSASDAPSAKPQQPTRGAASSVNQISAHPTPSATVRTPAGVTRINAPLGEVHLNYHKVTNGLARAVPGSPGAAAENARAGTSWGSNSGTNWGSSNNTAGGQGSYGSSGTATGVANGATAPFSPATAAIGAASTPAAKNNGNGNGNGNGQGNGNGNGNGQGNNGQGNNGQGNGNGGNGNGNGNGNGKGNGHGHS